MKPTVKTTLIVAVSMTIGLGIGVGATIAAQPKMRNALNALMQAQYWLYNAGNNTPAKFKAQNLVDEAIRATRKAIIQGEY